MVKRPADMNAFEFSVVSGLRAAQLHRGCTPRVEQCEKMIVTAQQEVAQRKVLRVPAVGDAVLRPHD
jgi:DNA-directed RNA polymerase subunit K/omega